LPPQVAPSSDPATAQVSVQSTSSKRGKKNAAEPLPAEIEQHIHQPSGMPDHLDDEEFSEVLDRKITDLNTRITNHEEITEKIEERLAKLEKRLQESEATIKKLKAIQAKKAPIEQASP
jgi:predicted ribosome quality control (RQC) complex YloA/Tae2 family protein